MASHNQLLEDIKTYLRDRSLSDGGRWPEVTGPDMDLLQKIIDELIELKYGQDSDGDLPVEVLLVNRTRWRLSPYEPIPHESTLEAENPGISHAEIYLQQLRRALYNLSIAMDDVTLYQKLWEFAEQKEKNGKQNS
jgi:hypothetical protein